MQIVNDEKPTKEKKTIRFEDQQKKPLPSTTPPLQSALRRKLIPAPVHTAVSPSPVSPQHSIGTASPPGTRPVMEQTPKSPDWAPTPESKKVAASSPNHNDATTSRAKVTEHPLKEEPAVPVKPSSDYRSEIARYKNMLVLFNNELYSALSTSQQLDLRTKLTDEIGRVSRLLDNGAFVAEEKVAYEEYATDLRKELDKWVQSSGHDNQTLSQNDDSLLGVEINRDILLKQSQSFMSERASTVGTSKADLESRGNDKERRLLPKQIKVSDQFPDVRKQWRTVNVMAPYTLPAGFQFEARIGDEIFTATVPPEGVTQGELFATRMGDIDGDTSVAAQRTRVFKDMDAPPSRWRDELFDCFRHGIDHPFLWNTILCPHIALSQVMARIQISDTGEPQYTLRSRTKVGWYAIFALFIIGLHAVYASFFIIASPDEDALLIATCPLVGLDVILTLYFYYMLIKTRRIVRREYDIPELRCRGNEDLCMAVCCTCCTLSQMGRHTADYETYRAYCCSDTGLAQHVEVKLPSDFLDDIEEGNDRSGNGGDERSDYQNYTPKTSNGRH